MRGVSMKSTVTGTIILCAVAAFPAQAAVGERVVQQWAFGGQQPWAGWTPSNQLTEVQADPDGVQFQSTGHDPWLSSPLFEIPATNSQWIEIDLYCSGTGPGQLYYTNKTEGGYSGFEPGWVSHFLVPEPGRRTISLWPFWGSIEKVIRLRFDPPSGETCKIYSIKIIEPSEQAAVPAWDFLGTAGSWRSMYAADLQPSDAGLVVQALRPQALLITPVQPFSAAERPLLYLRAHSGDEEVIGLYWATKENPGLVGEPIVLQRPEQGKKQDPGDKKNVIELDLRQFPIWQGTITHLAIGFGTHGGETLMLRSLKLLEVDPHKPVLRLNYLGFEQPINRPGKAARLKMIVQNAGITPSPAGPAMLMLDKKLSAPEPMLVMPALEPGRQRTLNALVVPREAGESVVKITFKGQEFVRQVRIDPPIEDESLLEQPEGYDVPEPRPVATDYEIGVYYFPGWANMDRWQYQDNFPERDPVLGYYREGMTEVADWQIKWAVENAIRFFVFDWYWRDGKEELTEGLNDGFLKARYNEMMRFAIMWANHDPFADHTQEQLLTVTDYWIEHYFNKPNYLTFEGKPYVSFFSPGAVLRDLGGEEQVHRAFEAMRTRCREAGLPGLHIAACGGADEAFLQSSKRMGYDSVTGYNYRRTGATLLQSPYNQFLMGHIPMWRAIDEAGVLPYMPLLTVGWDSRPWDGPRAERRFFRRPEDFAVALEAMKEHMDAHGHQRGLLEAWNEWGEGSYIEPNAEFGFEDLEAIRRVFAKGDPRSWPTNVAPSDVGLHGKYEQRK